MSGGIVVVKVKLQQDDENPQSSHGLLDHDLVQYYHFLADKGDVTAQVENKNLVCLCYNQGCHFTWKNLEKPGI